MGSTSDAMWIVEEMLEEILGRVYSRDIQEKFEAEKNDRIMVNKTKSDEQVTLEMSKEEKMHDWVNMIDEEMKELIGKCFPGEVGGNPENNVSEKKEEQFPEYAKMGFNWKEVEPIFKGQSESWIT
jgi:hypothetical protein